MAISEKTTDAVTEMIASARTCGGSENATEAYEKHAAQIRATTTLLEDALEVHHDRAIGEDGLTNWAFAGDLSHVNARMREVLMFIGGLDNDADAVAMVEEQIRRG